jgi:hypothetical protein
MAMKQNEPTEDELVEVGPGVFSDEAEDRETDASDSSEMNEQEKEEGEEAKV